MKTLFATAFAAAALVAVPAMAQTKPMPGGSATGNTLTYTLDAEIGVVCGVYGPGSQTISLDFGDLSQLSSTTDVTRSTNVAYRCNTTTGFSREVSSANGGNLVRTGSDTLGSNRLSYRFSEMPNSSLGMDTSLITTRSTLSTPVRSQHAGGQNYLTGLSTTQTFTVSGVARTGSESLNGAPGTTVFAGDYTDTVTVSVNAR